VTPTRPQTALVTGGNRGLGLETARQLAARGVTVLLGSRDLDAGVKAAERLGSPEVRPVRLDVTSDRDVADCRTLIEHEYGRLDILVNNAAVHYDSGETVLTADLRIAREAWETNLLGAWRLAQMAAPFMRRQRRGRIVNVSSEAGALGSMHASAPAYRASKIALNALTLMLADELRGSGVLVNAVCPGWVATDMGGRGGRPVTDGAAGIVWAAMLPDNGPTGGFFRDGKPIEW
jgi:NAD(P)-dependent dehydrogenase (short-subunit alcohol dehydrogenase family)